MSFTVTIAFDNKCKLPGLKSEWGFACVIETENEKILFDTGNDGNILLNNMARLYFFPRDFTRLIISHMHWDHVGGIPLVLQACPHCTAYLVSSALKDDVEIIKSLCHKVILVREPIEIVPNIYSTGEMPGYAWEQSVILKSSSGLLIITGCAHPGVVEVVHRVNEMFPGLPIKMLIGGFHLHHTAPGNVINICHQLRKAGVEQIAPAHCTGEEAILLCKNVFGTDFLEAGVGFSFSVS